MGSQTGKGAYHWGLIAGNLGRGGAAGGSEGVGVEGGGRVGGATGWRRRDRFLGTRTPVIPRMLSASLLKTFFCTTTDFRALGEGSAWKDTVRAPLFAMRRQLSPAGRWGGTRPEQLARQQRNSAYPRTPGTQWYRPAGSATQRGPGQGLPSRRARFQGTCPNVNPLSKKGQAWWPLTWGSPLPLPPREALPP